MTIHEQTALRRRLESVRRDDLTDAIITATTRIGGAGVLLAALREAESDRCRRAANKRHSNASRRVPA